MFDAGVGLSIEIRIQNEFLMGVRRCLGGVEGKDGNAKFGRGQQVLVRSF